MTHAMNSTLPSQSGSIPMFQNSSATRKYAFTKDNFVEDIEFAYMEIEVIEED